MFHDNLARLNQVETGLTQLLARRDAARFGELEAVLDFVESVPGLYDADRLAFREFLNDLQREIGRDGSLPAVRRAHRLRLNGAHGAPYGIQTFPGGASIKLSSVAIKMSSISS